MCAQFTEDDVGKRVVNADGDEVGIVSAVEHGTAHVEPDPGLTDTIRAKLGWEGTGEDTYPLQEETVERVTDDEIRLQGDLGATSTGTGAGSPGTDRGTDTGIGDDDSGLTDDDDDLIGDDDSGLTDDDDDLIGDDT